MRKIVVLAAIFVLLPITVLAEEIEHPSWVQVLEGIWEAVIDVFDVTGESTSQSELDASFVSGDSSSDSLGTDDDVEDDLEAPPIPSANATPFIVPVG